MDLPDLGTYSYARALCYVLVESCNWHYSVDPKELNPCIRFSDFVAERGRMVHTADPILPICSKGPGDTKL
jgi:hypothetical protein